jgi:hypothetical protein
MSFGANSPIDQKAIEASGEKRNGINFGRIRKFLLQDLLSNALVYLF